MAAPSNRTRFQFPSIGASDILLVLSSAFYWAWFDTVTFRPTLFAAGNAELYPCFLVITMLAGSLFLLAAFFKYRQIATKLSLNPYGAIVTLASIAAAGIVVLGSFTGLSALVVLGGVLVGVTCSYFLLEWACMYSRNGAMSAGPLMAASVVLGAVVDLGISSMESMTAAVFSALLPGIATGLLSVFDYVVRKTSMGTANLGAYGIQDFPLTERSAEIAGTEDVYTGGLQLLSNSRQLFGLPAGLVLSFVVFGFSFGFTVYLSSTDSVMASASPDLLLWIRGATCLVILLFMVLFPAKLYSIFKVGMLVGLAGFVVSPALGTLLDSSQLVASGVTVIGYTTFDIMTWSVLSEMSSMNGEHTLKAFGTGRFAVHAGVALGYATGFALGATGHLDQLSSVAQTTVGYLLAIAATPFIGNASALETIPRTIKPTAATAPDRSLETLAKEHGLTQRELEILEQLTMGRSRSRIAEALGISENTVGSHIKRIYDKMDIHGTQEAIDLLNH